MAIINSYPTVTPSNDDLLLLVDTSVEGNPTKTATVSSVAKQVTLGYSSFVAKLTQTGTNVPTMTEVSNDTGLTFTISRINPGAFKITPSSDFVINKTVGLITGAGTSTQNPGNITGLFINEVTTGFLGVSCINLVLGTAADGISYGNIEIRIYT
tara:strand:- start:112 stop:576 length:465 start_codon:yes stop_codon:yes gene_type:complete